MITSDVLQKGDAYFKNHGIWKFLQGVSPSNAWFCISWIPSLKPIRQILLSQFPFGLKISFQNLFSFMIELNFYIFHEKHYLAHQRKLRLLQKTRTKGLRSNWQFNNLVFSVLEIFNFGNFQFWQFLILAIFIFF